MRKLLVAALLGLLGIGVNTGAATAQSQRDEAYDLPEAGVFLEGIGVDQRRGVFYVSATNRDGTIYRGELGQQQLEVWVAPPPAITRPASTSTMPGAYML